MYKNERAKICLSWPTETFFLNIDKNIFSLGPSEIFAVVHNSKKKINSEDFIFN